MIKKMKHHTRTWELGLYNAYNRYNPFYYYVSEDLQGNGVLKQITLCLLYTSDAADERSSVDLGGRRIIKKKQ